MGRSRGRNHHVSRTTHKRVTATGLWNTSSEIVYFVCEFLLPAAICAQAIRHHWAIENRSHYVRDGSFREDDSRIRCNPGISARLRSFAANILRLCSVAAYVLVRARVPSRQLSRVVERAHNLWPPRPEESHQSGMAPPMPA